jgi:hypothetical protein
MVRSSVDFVNHSINLVSKKDCHAVIDACLPEAQSRVLASKCWSEGIPFLRIRANGLLGYVRFAQQELTMMETHNEWDKNPDLYISPGQVAHWPEYKAYLEGYNV